MIRKHGSEKRLGSLFDPFHKPGSKNDKPANDGTFAPIEEPDLDIPPLPYERPDQPWLV